MDAAGRRYGARGYAVTFRPGTCCHLLARGLCTASRGGWAIKVSRWVPPVRGGSCEIALRRRLRENIQRTYEFFWRMICLYYDYYYCRSDLRRKCWAAHIGRLLYAVRFSICAPQYATAGSRPSALWCIGGASCIFNPIFQHTSLRF